MRKIFILVIASSVTLLGCQTAPRQDIPPLSVNKVDKIDRHPEIPPEETVAPLSESQEKSTELQNIKDEDLREYTFSKGVIFAKADFQGLLKTSYVRLIFENLKDPAQRYQLYIGDKLSQKKLLWNPQDIQPSYFFIELPAGAYQISSIAIPVGTTLASEALDVRLNVSPNIISYAGTLKIIGTKEKIRLGGIPVIKPGFEYTVDVVDEQEEGINIFRQKYPQIPNEITIDLMQVPLSLDHRLLEPASREK
jgi:hypothetical protein